MTQNVLISKLSESVDKLLAPMSIGKTCATIVREAKEILGAETGSIYLDIDGDLKRVYTTVPVEQRVESRKRGNTQKAFDNQKIIILDRDYFKKIHPEFHQKRVSHVVLIPLVYDKKSIGVLSIQVFKNGDLTETENQSFVLFGNIAALKIKNSLINDELVKTLKTRDMFIALALHELNTPLTTLSGYLNLVKRKTPNKENGYMDAVLMQATRIREIIKGFEKFNQLRSDSKLNKVKKVNVKNALQKALLDFRARYPSYRVVIEEELGSDTPHVKADVYKLTEAFSNILDNAAKFSKDISPVVIQIKKDDRKVRISIIDNGIGMAKRDLRKVLSAHYKAGGNTRQGMGLGLYLTKNIIESYGGKIKMKSAPDKGTEVLVSLPSF